MSEYAPRTIRMYNGKVFGEKVSEYGLAKGYLDYYTLAKMVGNRILNNYIMEFVGFENWELVLGDEEDSDIYQYYIITDPGYELLRDLTDEIVYYNEELGMFLWCITHFGTGWDYILTDIKLEEMKKWWTIKRDGIT